MDRRPYVLGGVLAVLMTLSIIILFDVLATVFLALTVAFLLAPLRRHLKRRGAPQLVATIAATATAVVGVLALFSPLVYLLFVRFGDVVELIGTLPESITIEWAGIRYEIVVTDVFAAAASELQTVAADILAGLPVLFLKVALFVLLVFSLLYNERNIRTNVFDVVPPSYRDIAEALHKRARETLYALYVIQAATGFATFLIAIPVFVAFDYSSPIVLATVAGILQFVPIAGPSVLIVALVGSHLFAGELLSAALIGVVGGLLIVALPDLVIRPRLASRQADLDSSLYFIGFVGGLLSLGAIGIIVGPLVVALLVEAAGLVAEEFDMTDPDPEETEEETPPASQPQPD